MSGKYKRKRSWIWPHNERLMFTWSLFEAQTGFSKMSDHEVNLPRTAGRKQPGALLPGRFQASCKCVISQSDRNRANVSSGGLRPVKAPCMICRSYIWWITLEFLDCVMLISAYATPLCSHLTPCMWSWGLTSWRHLCTADHFSSFSWQIWLRSTTRSAAWLAALTTPSTTPPPSSPPAGSSTPPPPWTFLGGTPPFTGAWVACRHCARPSTTQSGWTVTENQTIA